MIQSTKVICLLFLVVGIQISNASNIHEIWTPANDDFYTEVSFEYVKNKIIIPVTVEGETYRFILDTGAPTIISERLQNKITTTNATSMSVKDGTSKKAVLKKVNVPNIGIGNLTFNNVRSLVYDLHEKSLLRCFEVDGLIGSHVFGKGILQINVPERKIIFTNIRKKLNLNRKDGMKMQLRGAQMSPYIWVGLSGEETAKERLLIDTGMGDEYDPSSETYNSLKSKRIFDLVSVSTGASSASLLGEAPSNKQGLILVPSLSIMKHNFTNIVSITTASDHSRIGMAILEKGIMTLDYKKKKFYFSKDESTVNLDNKTPRISITVNNDQLAVGFIWDASLKGKIKFGDQIVSLNDIPMSQDTMCDVVVGRTGFGRNEARTASIMQENGEILTINLNEAFANTSN